MTAPGMTRDQVTAIAGTITDAGQAGVVFDALPGARGIYRDRTVGLVIGLIKFGAVTKRGSVIVAVPGYDLAAVAASLTPAGEA